MSRPACCCSIQARCPSIARGLSCRWRTRSSCFRSDKLDTATSNRCTRRCCRWRLASVEAPPLLHAPPIVTWAGAGGAHNSNAARTKMPTAFRTARRKSPSPANRPAPISLRSSGLLACFRLKFGNSTLADLARWPPRPHRSPTLRIEPKIPPQAWTLTASKARMSISSSGSL